jgi:hypothetical protein
MPSSSSGSGSGSGSSSESESETEDSSDSDYLKGKEPATPPAKVQEAVLVRWYNTFMWFYKNTRSLLVQTRLSLEKHEPENAD